MVFHFQDTKIHRYTHTKPMFMHETVLARELANVHLYLRKSVHYTSIDSSFNKPNLLFILLKTYQLYRCNGCYASVSVLFSSAVLTVALQLAFMQCCFCAGLCSENVMCTNSLRNSKGGLAECKASEFKLHFPAALASKCGNVTKHWPVDGDRSDASHFESDLFK